MTAKNNFISLFSYIDCEGGLQSCWPWLTGTNSFGYGRISINGKRYIAHRTVYKHFHGAIKPGNVIRHVCDNRKCCNPLHLLQGTQADNVQDMIERSRMPQKIEHETILKMAEYWKSGYSQRQIAKIFGHQQCSIQKCFKRLGIRKV